MKKYRILDTIRVFSGVVFEAEEVNKDILEAILGRSLPKLFITQTSYGYLVRNEHFTLKIYEVN